MTPGQKLFLLASGAAALAFAARPRTASAASSSANAPGQQAPTGYQPTGYQPDGSYYDPYFTPQGGGSTGTVTYGVPSGTTSSAERWASPVRGTPATWRLQNQLADLGYNPGVIDGRVGPDTRRAAEDFARAYGTTVPAMLTGSFAQRVESLWRSSGGSESGMGGASAGGTQIAKGDGYGGDYYDPGSTLYDPGYDALAAKGVSGFEDVPAALAGFGRYARRY